jgi:hypothetical protein
MKSGQPALLYLVPCTLGTYQSRLQSYAAIATIILAESRSLAIA